MDQNLIESILYRNYFKYKNNAKERDIIYTDNIFNSNEYAKQKLYDYDPDGFCYVVKDFSKLLGNMKIDVNYFEKNKLKINNINCSSDYIGPSRKQLLVKLDNSNYIINALRISRTIGGHICFPVHKPPTINTYRGNKLYYDRIDLCLKAIHHYFENNPKL